MPGLRLKVALGEVTNGPEWLRQAQTLGDVRPAHPVGTVPCGSRRSRRVPSEVFPLWRRGVRAGPRGRRFDACTPQGAGGRGQTRRPGPTRGPAPAELFSFGNAVRMLVSTRDNGAAG